MAAVLATGGLIAAAGPAGAEWINDPNGDVLGHASAGYIVYGSFGTHDSSFLGAVTPPVNHAGETVFCIEGNQAAPGVSGAASTDAVLTDQQAARVAYAIDRYGQDRSNAMDMAAVSYIVHTQYDTLAPVYEAATPDDIKARAADIWNDAIAHAGDYVAGLAVNTYGSAGQMSGTVHFEQVSVHDKANGALLYYPADVPLTVTLSGPAVVDDNGNGLADPGEDNVWTGATDGSAERTIPWAATDTGTVGHSVAYDKAALWSNVLSKYSVDAYQTTVADEGGDPLIEGETYVEFGVVRSFQPKLRTQVAYKYVEAGHPIIDGVEGYVDEGETWVPYGSDPYVDLLANLDIYGPLAAAPATPSDTVPAGTPLLGTDTAIVTGPGAEGAGRSSGSVIAPSSGYYPIVAKFLVENQPAEKQHLFKGDFTDKYGLTDETAITPMTLTMTSDVPAFSEILSKGPIPVDKFTIDVDGLWLAEVGKSDPTDLPFFYEVSEPVTEHGVTIKKVVQRAEFTADHEGTFTTGEDGVPALSAELTSPSGVYSIRHGIDTSKLTDAQRQILADESEKLDSGWWAEGESFVRRMAPVVTTKVAIADFYQANPDDPAVFPVIDNVTVALKDKGDLWLTENGKPVELATVNTFHGMYDRAVAQRPLDATDAAKVIGSETVTFTAPGTKATSGATKTTGVGFGFWDTKVNANPKWFDGYQSDAFIEPETVSVHRAPGHVSMAREYNVEGGGRAFDTMTNTNLWPDAGQWAGVGKWAADATEAKVILWAYPTAPATVDAPSDAVKVWERPYSELVTNGTHLIGWTDQDKVGLPKELPFPDGTYFVFQYVHPGDSRTAPYKSAFNDIREQMFARQTESDRQLDPTIGSTADETAPIGSTFGDKVVVSGAAEALTDREGAEYIINRAYLVKAGQNPAKATDATLVFTSPKVNDVVTGRVYDTDLDAAAAAGLKAAGAKAGDQVWWVATLYGADNKVLATGKWGDPAEITDLTEGPWFATQALRVTDPQTGAAIIPVKGIVPTGAMITDSLLVGGTFDQDVTVQLQVVHAPTGKELTDPEAKPVWETTNLVIPAGSYDGEGEDSTFQVPGGYTIPDDADGTYGFVATLLDEKYNNYLRPGTLGEESETLRAIEVTTLAHTSDAKPDEQDDHSDEISVVGPVTEADGIYADSTLTGVPAGTEDWATVCTPDNAIWTSPTIAFPEQGSAYTPTTTIPEDQRTGQLDGVTWQERVYVPVGEPDTIPGQGDPGTDGAEDDDPNTIGDNPDQLIDQGECGNTHESKHFVPQVVTTAIAVADPDTSMKIETIPVVGDIAFDTFTTKGTFPEGSTVTVDAYYAEPGQPFDAEHVTKVWTSQPVTVTNDVREYRTSDGFDTSSLTKGGTLGFVERLRDKDGEPVRDRNVTITRDQDGKVTVTEDDGKKVVPDGKLGEPSETLTLVNVTTTLVHEDTNRDGLMSDGDKYGDDIHLTGDLPQGSKVELSSDVFTVDPSKVTFGQVVNTGGVSHAQIKAVDPTVCTAEAKVNTLRVDKTVTTSGTYRTGMFTLERADVTAGGAITMRETAKITVPVVDGDGAQSTVTRVVTGKCGAIDETGGPLAQGKFESGGFLPQTGAGIALLGGAVLALLAAAAGVLLVVRRRGHGGEPVQE